MARALEYRATMEAVGRAYAIDKDCARVREIEEKVTHDEQKKGLSAGQVFADMKDAIRYTFQYPHDKYAAGVQADVQRLKNEGAEYADSRNTWTSEQYKGINSWWRDGDSGQLFEVQFHTQASFDAKQETHGAYERLRRVEDDNGEYDEEFGRDLAWTRSWVLYSYEHGNGDNQLYEITEEEADRIVERIRRSVTGQPT